MPHAITSRILFVDAYDSFSNNIISMLETRLSGVEVTAIKIDEQIPDFPALLKDFDGVVAGPGPGHPGNQKDVGLISQLWQLQDEDMLPVLGICLGFQSLVAAFGGSVVRLATPRHGIVRTVSHNGTSIFKGVGSIASVEYHSLHAQLHQDASMPRSRRQSDNIKAFNGVEELQALAWDIKFENNNSTRIQEHAVNPEIILMAAKHRRKPFHGLQFHPESICSDEECQQTVTNWWAEAQEWNKQHKSRNTNRQHENSITEPLLLKVEAMERLILRNDVQGGHENDSGRLSEISVHTSPREFRPVCNRVLPLGGLTVPQICDLLKIGGGETVVLDSEPHQRADVGTHSIIGALEPATLKFDYTIGCVHVTAHQLGGSETIDLRSHGHGIFDFLKAFVNARKTAGGNPDIPFWGGLIGYISYEACLETLEIKKAYPTAKPDISFAFVERSVVVDHPNQQIHIQSIKSEDDSWVNMIALMLATCTPAPRGAPSIPLDSAILDPDVSSYKSKIRKCQEHIHNGESYELCLTNRACINSSHISNAWPLYLRLRSLNAAPFSAYIRLGGLTLLSSSPERFMRWTRPNPTLDGHAREVSTVQFRPIKGTVRRYPNGPDKAALSLEQATALLSTPKERAENLMIVDLIRHDLHGVVGSGNVCVPKLMVVEEYATLFQLVTVVEGTLFNQQMSLSNPPSLTTSSQSSPGSSRPHTPTSSASSSSCNRISHKCSSSRNSGPFKTGIDVLAASLPPGSMTGAPKRRSCALLQDIEEQQARGIYSGIVGYMDVGGGGDFSVVIRSAFKWDEDTVDDEKDSNEKRDTWTVGAGGAITSLSTEDGEWEEMVAKLGSILRMFE